MKARVAALVVFGIAILGVSLHAAGLEVAGQPFLCALCPFC